MLIPAVQGEVQRGNYDSEARRSGLDVRIYRDLPVAKITGLEIFQTGTHNGDFYSDSDLDSMVSAFSKVGFQPTVKAGHADGQDDEKQARRVFGAPALGYVKRIYRVGSKLLADIKDVPRRFAELVEAGAWKRVSAEIYWSYAKNGHTYPRVLKSVALGGTVFEAIGFDHDFRPTERPRLFIIGADC